MGHRARAPEQKGPGLACSLMVATLPTRAPFIPGHPASKAGSLSPGPGGRAWEAPSTCFFPLGAQPGWAGCSLATEPAAAPSEASWGILSMTVTGTRDRLLGQLPGGTASPYLRPGPRERPVFPEIHWEHFASAGLCVIFKFARSGRGSHPSPGQRQGGEESHPDFRPRSSTN